MTARANNEQLWRLFVALHEAPDSPEVVELRRVVGRGVRALWPRLYARVISRRHYRQNPAYKQRQMELNEASRKRDPERWRAYYQTARAKRTPEQIEADRARRRAYQHRPDVLAKRAAYKRAVRRRNPNFGNRQPPTVRARTDRAIALRAAGLTWKEVGLVLGIHPISALRLVRKRRLGLPN